jgi:hypothetical protein
MSKKKQYKRPHMAKKTQEKQAMIAAMVPYELYIFLKDTAAKEHRSLSSQVVMYLEEHLKDKMTIGMDNA